MEELRRSLREAPIVERDDYEYFVHGITDGVPPLEPAVLREIADGLAAEIDAESTDLLLAPEAMGIHHAAALSLATELPMGVIRKRSYGFDDEVAVHQETSYGDSELHLNGVGPGDRVVLVDDVLSSGGTIRAVCAALDSIGADLRDVVVVLRRSDVDHGDLPHDVTALQDVRVTDGAVEFVD